MKTIVKAVRLGGKQVDTATISLPDSVAEATSTYTEADLIVLLHDAITRREMNRVRTVHLPPRTGKRERMRVAYNCLTREEIDGVAGDFEAFQTLLNSPDVQARVSEKIGVEVSPPHPTDQYE